MSDERIDERYEKTYDLNLDVYNVEISDAVPRGMLKKIESICDRYAEDVCNMVEEILLQYFYDWDMDTPVESDCIEESVIGPLHSSGDAEYHHMVEYEVDGLKDAISGRLGQLERELAEIDCLKYVAFESDKLVENEEV